MTRFARIFVVALIAVFTAWSSAHVANATTMTLEMTTAADGEAMNMADCDVCDSREMGNEASLACDIACVSPALADLATDQPFVSAPVASHARWSAFDFAGRAYPPDPHPPRAVLLI